MNNQHTVRISKHDQGCLHPTLKAVSAKIEELSDELRHLVAKTRAFDSFLQRIECVDLGISRLIRCARSYWYPCDGDESFNNVLQGWAWGSGREDTSDGRRNAGRPASSRFLMHDAFDYGLETLAVA